MTDRQLFSEERSAEVVAASFAGTPDPRLRQVMTSLVQPPARVRQGRRADRGGVGRRRSTSSPAPGRCATTCGRSSSCSPTCSGVSMLVETINHRTGGTSTESTVLGPFHMVESPRRELGDDIALDGKGTPVPGVGPGDRSGRRAAGRARRWTSGRPTRTASTTSSSRTSSRTGNLRGLFTADDAGPVLVPVGRAALLPDPRRRPGRAAAGGDRPAPVPAGAPALHRRRPGLPAGDHARVRRRQPRTWTPTPSSGSRRAWSGTCPRSTTRPGPRRPGCPTRSATCTSTCRCCARRRRAGSRSRPTCSRPSCGSEPS